MSPVLDRDPQDLAAQVVRVQRRATGVDVRRVEQAAVGRDVDALAVVDRRHRDGERRCRAGQRRPSPVMSGTFCSALLPRKLTVRVPVPVTATSSMFESASSAASMAALSSGNGDRRRGLAVERERERAAGRVGDRDRLALVRQLAVERPEAAGVAAAGRRVVTGDQPQVVVRVEVDVARDVAARAAVVRRRAGSAARSRGRGAPALPPLASTNLKRESWK